MHDERSLAVGRRDGSERAQVEAGRDHLGLGHPAQRVEGADDLRVGALAVRELGGRLAADVRAEVVEDGLLPGRAEDRELERLRDERQAEVEVEDVGARQQARERAPLRELLPREAGWAGRARCPPRGGAARG